MKQEMTAAAANDDLTDDLTDDQRARLDLVHNAIYQLMNELVPESYRTTGKPANGLSGGNQFAWDMHWIGDLSDQFESWMAKLLNVPAEETEDFQMAFAPFFEMSDAMANYLPENQPSDSPVTCQNEQCRRIVENSDSDGYCSECFELADSVSIDADGEDPE